jgi:hypothetical protein
MSPSTPRATARPAKVPVERTHFKELLLANHFSAAGGGKLTQAVAKSGNTTYEQLMCVGYQPQLKRLDAVVHIKQGSGYSGNLCTSGSQEYVKFFISSDGGTTWSEQGTVSFTVWDVAGTKPLEFDATLFVDLDEACCKHEHLLQVRAILSWEVPPGGADDPVVWGNALDATIQVEPIKHGTLHELFECLELKIPIEKVKTLVDPGAPVEFGISQQLTPLELHETYKATKVPQHRYLLSHLQDVLANPAALPEQLAQPGFQVFPGIDVDISKLIGFVLDPQGNETYEQIGCVGLNENTAELVATVDLKLSSGYSGGLCTGGSQEFVAFWVDWDDGSGLQYAGTTSVNVHDITTIPKGGLSYSAVLPFLRRRPADRAYPGSAVVGDSSVDDRPVCSAAVGRPRRDSYSRPARRPDQRRRTAPGIDREHGAPQDQQPHRPRLGVVGRRFHRVREPVRRAGQPRRLCRQPGHRPAGRPRLPVPAVDER